jgi:uncharacterized protein (DUF2252 family)
LELRELERIGSSGPVVQPVLASLDRFKMPSKKSLRPADRIAASSSRQTLIESLTVEDAMKPASFMAGVIGKAHVRQLDNGDRQAWTKELERHRSNTLDAPNWLWSSVVELIDRDEVAHLEHCRKFASQTVSSAWKAS